MAHFYEPIKQTVPPAKPPKASLMKQIHTARQANVSINDICAKLGMDVLERMFGATAVKKAFIMSVDKVKGKKAEVAYGALRKKRKVTNKHFKDKKEYVIRYIEHAITRLTPIRVNHKTGEIEGGIKMKTPTVTMSLFDNDYLEESNRVIERLLQRNLTLLEVEEVINNLLDLEELVRRLNHVPQE